MGRSLNPQWEAWAHIFLSLYLCLSVLGQVIWKGALTHTGSAIRQTTRTQNLALPSILYVALVRLLLKLPVLSFVKGK